VQVEGERVEVACRWAGGVQTRHATTRPVRRFEQLRGFDQVLALVRDLRRQGCSAARVAERLNVAGRRPPKRDAFDAAMVRRLVLRHGLGSGRPIWSSNVARTPGAEWTLHEAAQRLGIHRHTAYRWLRDGRLRGRMADRGEQRIWLVQMNGDEFEQAKAASPPPRTRNPT
jgi:excisionase family DNA binding protein